MATWADVRRLALALPETTEDEGDTATWRVRGKNFAWERPLRRRDLEDLGESAPTGAILGIRVADVGEKDALIAASPGCFTIAHFAGYPAVLVLLDKVEVGELQELLTDAWLAKAPKRLAMRYLDENQK